MNWNISRVSLDDFLQALRNLGYYKVGVTSGWRKGSFHLFIRKRGKKGLKIHLHRDVFERSGAPVFQHKCRKQGKDLEREKNRIKEQYLKVRRT